MYTSDQFFHHLQPIYSTESLHVIGYEGFLRSKNNLNPQQLFDEARRNDQLISLDLLSIELLLSNLSKYETDKLFFINIFPSTLIHPTFLNLLEKYQKVSSTNIIIELNEHHSEGEIWDNPLLKEKIQQLKSFHIPFAIDDIGQGQATMQKVIEYEPNFMKVDKYYSTGLSTCLKKQKTVAYFVDYCNTFNIGCILEGIEKEADYIAAKRLGVLNVQGFLFGKPKEIERILEKPQSLPKVLDL